MAISVDKTITIKFRGDTMEFEGSVTNIDKMIKTLAKDTKDIEKKIKLDPSNQEEYARAISNTASALELAQKQYDAYGAEIEEFQSLNRELTTNEVNQLNTAIRKRAEYGRQISNFTDQLARLKREYENFAKLQLSQKLVKVGGDLNTIGNSVQKIADSFKYVSMAAGAALGGARASAVSFEEAMSNVRKVLRDEDQGMFDTLKSDILEMSRSLPISAEKIAEVTANALQLGVRAEDVSKFTDTILKLGTATNITAEDAAITLAQFFNVTGEGLENVDKFGAVLVELGNRFPAFESGIMEMAQRLAAAASGVGMTSQEILGLSTALVSTGLNAEAGGSAISNILRTIDTQVATSGKKLSAWAEAAGMSVEQFQNAWSTDAAGTFQTIIGNLRNSEENLNLQMDNLGISAIRQKDAFSRLVGAYDTLNAAMSDSENAWAEVARGQAGALEEEFANKIQNVASQLQLLKNELYYLAVEVGNRLLPYITDFVDKLKGILDWFLGLSPEVHKFIAGFLIRLAGIYPVLKTIGGAISTVGKLLMSIGTIIGKNITFGVAKEGLAAAFTNIGNVVLGWASAFAVPLGVLAAMAAAFVLLFKNNEEFRGGILALVADLKDRLKVIIDHLLSLFHEFSDWFMGIFQPLLDYLKKIWEEWLSPTLSALFTSLTELLFDAIVIIFNWISKIIEFIVRIAKPVITVVIDTIKFIASLIAIVVGVLGNALDIGIKIIKWLIETADPILSWLIDVIGTAIEDMVTFAGVLMDGVFKAIQFVIDAIGGLINKLKDAKDWLLEVLGLQRELNSEEAKASGKSATTVNIGSVATNAVVNAHTNRSPQAIGSAVTDAVNRSLGKMLTNF